MHITNVNIRKMVQDSTVETQLVMCVVFIAKTTCFGPCTWPSSGLELCVRGDYTVYSLL